MVSFISNYQTYLFLLINLLLSSKTDSFSTFTIQKCKPYTSFTSSSTSCLFAFPNSDRYEYNKGGRSNNDSRNSHEKKHSNNKDSKLRDQKNHVSKTFNAAEKQSLSKRHYRQTSDEDDIPLSTTDETRNVRGGGGRGRENNHGMKNSNTANEDQDHTIRSNAPHNQTRKNHHSKRKHKQQRRQERMKANNHNGRNYKSSHRNNKHNHSNNNNSSSSNNSSNRHNRRSAFSKEIEIAIEIDLTKPTFTYHDISPPLQHAEQDPQKIIQQQQRRQRNREKLHKTQVHRKNNPNYTPIPPAKHVISPSVLQQNEQNCIPYICGNLPVTYTNDPQTVHTWLEENITRQYNDTFSVIGFDTEAVPDVPWRESNFPNRPATVQLSTLDSSLVWHLTPNYDHDRSLLQPLQELLADPTIIKAGAGIDDDMLELYRWDNSLNARSRFDLGGIGSSANGNRVGLQRLVRAVVGLELPKSKRVAMSDWGQVPLSMKQLNYASRDAWAGAAVMENLGLMYEDTMHVDLIGSQVLEMERDMVELDIRARERKEAKIKLKEIVTRMKQFSNYLKRSKPSDKDHDDGRHQIVPGSWANVVREERRRLQQIIDDTAPDGLIYFPQESLGLDFSFERKGQ